MVILGTPANGADFAAAFLKGSKQYFSRRPLAPGGTGPFAPASHHTHPSLPGHTIYAPTNLSARLSPNERLPVLVWANGMGLAWGLMFGAFLREIASHGYIVIANGAPGDTSGRTARWLGRLKQAPASAMVDAVRWARSSGGDELDPDDVRARMDGSRIALAGQSKGGLDAYAVAASLRDGGEAAGIRTVGIFNSGLISRNKTALALVRGLDVPVFYFIGGPADIAYRNAEEDWELLPGTLPAWCGSLNVGHMGTYYDDEAGGRFGRAAVDWLNCVFKEDREARRRMLLEYEGEGWKVKSRNLEL